MPMWTYICEEHGALFRTKSGRDGHQRRLGCHPRKLKPAEQLQVSPITRASLRDDTVRGMVGDLDGWGE